MTGKTKHRTAAAALGPKIVDRPKAQGFDRETCRREPLNHQRLTSAIDRADRLSPNQRLSQLQGARHQKRRMGRWCRRLTHNPNPPSTTALINTHAAIANPRNLQVTRAQSAVPVSTLTNTSLKEKTLSMKSSDAPHAGTLPGGKL